MNTILNRRSKRAEDELNILHYPEKGPERSIGANDVDAKFT